MAILPESGTLVVRDEGAYERRGPFGRHGSQVQPCGTEDAVDIPYRSLSGTVGLDYATGGSGGDGFALAGCGCLSRAGDQATRRGGDVG